jgi:hypothetical protein
MGRKKQSEDNLGPTLKAFNWADGFAILVAIAVVAIWYFFFR